MLITRFPQEWTLVLSNYSTVKYSGPLDDFRHIGEDTGNEKLQEMIQLIDYGAAISIHDLNIALRNIFITQQERAVIEPLHPFLESYLSKFGKSHSFVPPCQQDYLWGRLAQRLHAYISQVETWENTFRRHFRHYPYEDNYESKLVAFALSLVRHSSPLAAANSLAHAIPGIGRDQLHGSGAANKIPPTSFDAARFFTQLILFPLAMRALQDYLDTCSDTTTKYFQGKCYPDDITGTTLCAFCSDAALY